MSNNYNSTLQSNNTDLQTVLQTLQTKAAGSDPFAPVSPFTYTVDAISGAQYGFIKNSNGYYESQNKGQNNSYAICRVNLTVTSTCDIVFDVINYAESNYDYAVFGNLDSALALSNSADSSAKQNFKGQQSASVVNVTYSGVTAGNHYIDIKFIKDSSVNNNNDSVQFKLQEQKGGLSQETINKILAADTDLVAENIKSGINIFGIVGSNTSGFPNGTAWTKSNLTSEIGYNVRNENGIWVASVYKGGFYYSTDGKIWTKSNITSGLTGCILYGNKIWVAGCAGYMYYSTNGKSWTKATGINNTLDFGAYANKLFVGSYISYSDTNGLYYSTDGKTWTNVVLDGAVKDIIYSDGNWFAAVIKSNETNVTHIYQSVDGKAWTEISSVSGIGMDFISCFDGLFIGSTDNTFNNAVYYSTDGKTWTKSNISASTSSKPIYGNGIYVLPTAKGLYYSTDGKTWTVSNISSNKSYRAMYSNGIWVADNSYKIYYSTDGKTWIESCALTDSARHYCQCIENANGIWVLGTWEDGIYYSVTWEP